MLIVRFFLHLADLILPALVNVAFVTLFERKILGLRQLRRGPTKVQILGLLQPIGDAVKLFRKEVLFLNMISTGLYLISPVLGITTALWLWTTLPQAFSRGRELRGLLILTILRLGVYPVFLAGWASNSKFAQLGGLRAVAQTISYEIRLAFILFSLFSLSLSLGASEVHFRGGTSWLITFPLITLWFITCVAETNRTPFDFAEGESELVSGFNVEFGAGLFAIIFMAEYGMILFFSMLTPVLFLRRRLRRGALEIWAVFLRGVWMWLRRSFPRYRYDKLLNLSWKRILPLSLALACLFTRIRVTS